MISSNDYKYHVEALGSVKTFNEMIEMYHKVASWLSDEEIEQILKEEENRR